MNDSNALTTGESPWWAKLLDRFGVSTAILALLMIGLFRAGQWIATTVVQPLASAHLQFLRDASATMTQQTNIMDRMSTENTERFAKLLDGQATIIGTIMKRAENSDSHVIEALNRQTEVLKRIQLTQAGHVRE
jgi:hypothetical protein